LFMHENARGGYVVMNMVMSKHIYNMKIDLL